MNERIKRLWEQGRLRKIIILTGFLGIALIFLSNFISFGGEKPPDTTAQSYGEQMQASLERVLPQIRGAGKTQVLLTMENSAESVYTSDGATKTKEVEPKIRGVLVVCEGGDDPVVAEQITKAVTRTLDISAAKVCIAKLSE